MKPYPPIVKLDPMKTMQTCSGDSCDCVPDQVSEAIHACLEQVPRGDDYNQRRDLRAEWLAPRMAAEEWRFCPCFHLLRTEEHAWIFDLVHVKLANRLAHRAAMERAA
jgi:hypothetical protein